ncbi:hypothetical protein V1509DRAFT_669960 [Lipomyces kononenkoae]
MAQPEFLDQVRRPVSPDAQIEVPACQEDYERVKQIIEDEGQKDEVKYSLRKNTHLTSGISTFTDNEMIRTTQNGCTTRAWDSALQYVDGSRSTIMIAIEVGVSQEYESLRRAISWWVCAWRCRLGLAMLIRESPRLHERGQAQRFTSQQEAEASVEATEVFVLETYRIPEVITPDTLLEPTQTFRIVHDGECVGYDVAPNLREVVLTDCIPDYILGDQGLQARPVDFFHRDWFERTFGSNMVRTALNRISRAFRVDQIA